MWWSKEKSEDIKPVAPKETTRRAAMEIVLINNRTDKEYRVKSDNNFGFIIRVEDEGLIVLNQKKDLSGDLWYAKARFFEFSLVEIIWQTFDII